MSQRFIVIKVDDVQRLLNDEERQWLDQFLGNLTLRRAQQHAQAAQGQQVPTPQAPRYFTLDLRDKYAIAAIEKYIEEIDVDDANRSTPACRKARKEAWDAREWAINNTNGDQLPT